MKLVAAKHRLVGAAAMLVAVATASGSLAAPVLPGGAEAVSAGTEGGGAGLSSVAQALWKELVEPTADPARRANQVLDLVTFSKMWVLPAPTRLQLAAGDRDASSTTDNHEVLYGMDLESAYSADAKVGWRKLVGFYRPGDHGQAKHSVFRFGGGGPAEYEATHEFSAGERLTLRLVAGESGQPATVERLYREPAGRTDGQADLLSHPEVVKIREALSKRGGRPLVTREQAGLLRGKLGQRDGPLLLGGKHPAKRRPVALKRVISVVRAARSDGSRTGAVVQPFAGHRDRRVGQERVAAFP